MKNKFVLSVIILLIVLSVTIIFAVTVGSANINMLDAFKILCSRFLPIDLEFPTTHIKIIWDIRLVRILIAGLIGMGLSISRCSLSSYIKKCYGRSIYIRCFIRCCIRSNN